MPYINQKDRARIYFKQHNEIRLNEINNAGDMQYAIAVMIKEYLGEKYRYQDLNDVMGALAGAQMEFYRRVVSVYEDEKIKTNGDV